MRTRRHFFLVIAEFLPFAFFQRFEGAFLRREQQFRQGFVAQGSVDEDQDQGRDADGHDVKQPPHAFPAGASRIIKDWLSHEKTESSS